MIAETNSPMESASHLGAEIPLLGPDCEVRCWDEIRRQVVNHALAAHNGNVTAVAEALGVSRSTLYRWLCDEKCEAPPRVLSELRGRSASTLLDRADVT